MMIETQPYPENTVSAFVEYLRRYNKYTHPKGKDVKGRWLPSPEEVRPCCKGVKIPLLKMHCHSLEHVSALYDADARDVQKIINIYTGHEEKNESPYALNHHPKAVRRRRNTLT